jgi:uncharacterized protein YlzI (FlbEa/FlbD family)
MNDADIIKIIIENTKAMQNMQDTISSLYKTMDNLINSLHQNNTSTELTTQKVEILQDKIDDVLSKIEETRKKIDMLVVQTDFAEIQKIKAKKLNERLNKNLDKKKINWADIGETIKLSIKNSKWILLTLIVIILIVLVILKIIRLDEAWQWLQKLLPIHGEVPA